MMVKYTLINYFDVWGNEGDGFEVNNLCKEGEIELTESPDDQEILTALIDFGFIREDVTLEQIDIAAYDLDFIEFFQASNQYPIGRLEVVR
jgi:hypothetical protein